MTTSLSPSNVVAPLVAVDAIVIVSASVLVIVTLDPAASLTLSVELSLPVSVKLAPPDTVSALIAYVAPVPPPPVASAAGAQAVPFHFSTCPVEGAVPATSNKSCNLRLSGPATYAVIEFQAVVPSPILNFLVSVSNPNSPAPNVGLALVQSAASPLLNKICTAIKNSFDNIFICFK